MELYTTNEIVDNLQVRVTAFLSGEGVEVEDVSEELAREVINTYAYHTKFCIYVHMHMYICTYLRILI
jgi:hypothetical protein